MMRRRVLAGSIAILVAVATVVAAPQRAPATSTAEAATARRLAAIRDDPLLLRAFLREMPKGGDLHSHLSGAVYAESYLRWAAEDKLCLATATMSIVAGTCDAEAGQPPVAAVLQNPTLYNQAIDAMSMRHWNPALNGHDHFFAAFARFGPVTARTGDMLAEATARAAAEHVIYLELMLTPASAAVTRLARETGWNADLVELRSRLLAAGFREAVRAEASRRLDVAEVRRREILGCDGSQADPGCSVTVRYIAQVGRTAAPEVVFAQILAGFELVAADPRFVALNLVQAEDHPTSVRDFTLHMSMLDFLHRQYPNVRITLHAGELTSGLVPPEVLRSHVRQSVESGHAARIGHGIDLMDEDNPTALLRLLAAKKVLIETSLTSNDWILGVRGKHHPLRTYLRHGVPAAIVTDDLGVLRSSHTQEFQRAVEDQQLDYLTLKRLARNSLEHAFADWATKGRLQSDLERAFVDFERRQSAWQAPSRTTSDLHKRSAARPSEALRPTR